jgi:NAD(P)H-nitrite reductase large subunit
MQKYKYLIIGGGAAGTSAAETIRNIDKEGSLAIISDEKHPLYSRVMLSKPNFFLGKIPFEQIFLKGLTWYKENNVHFLSEKTVSKIDSVNKTLILSDNTELTYEKLLIATGVKPRLWDIKGSEKKGVHYLRTIEDGQAIMDAVKTTKQAITVGGGFISFEMADLFHMANIDTTMILRESYFWEPTLDEASGIIIEKALTKGGVKIIKNNEVVEVLGDESVEGVLLKDGTRLPCQAILCGIGIINNVDWVKNSNIETNRGILANEYMETSAKDIYTAGDIAEYDDLILEEKIQMGNWVNAHEQGRIAGLNMTGRHEAFKFVSFYTTQGFETSIAFVGDASYHADRLIIKRGDPTSLSYARIIVVNKEIVGATLINRTYEMSSISNLIMKNIDVSSHIEKLSDPNFDLKTLYN